MSTPAYHCCQVIPVFVGEAAAAGGRRIPSFVRTLKSPAVDGTVVHGRRRLLRTASGLALVAVAGCPSISDDDGNGDDGGAADGDEGADDEIGDDGEAGDDGAEGEAGEDDTDEEAADGDEGEAEEDQAAIDAQTVTSITDGDRVVELLTTSHFAEVGDIQETDDERYRYFMNVRANAEGQDSFAEGLEEMGAYDEPEEYTLRTHLDGEVVVELPLDEDLADHVESGDWEGELMMLFRERDHAEGVRDAIEAE